MELLIATKNRGKISELAQLLADLPFTLRSLNDFPDTFEPEETGMTFAENAALKAKFYSLQTGLWALADDSGLEVEALGGAPGVLSARYGGGKDASDAQKNEKLLSEMETAETENRAAQFVCAMAISDETGEIKFLTEGICRGKLSGEARGTNGFGYDPIFIPDGFSETFGELESDIKQQISHRARATGKIIEYLRGFSAT